MEALQYIAATKQLNLVRVPIPKILQSGQVLVKVAYSGVCGTDVHIIQGLYPCTQRPLILGHEFSGTIADLSPDILHLNKHDRVVVDPNSCCNNCEPCHQGNPHFCVVGGHFANLGVKNDGGWADYCLCGVEQVHKVPEGISLELGALTEPLSCLSHGWDIVAPLPIGKKILITGAGIIGTLWGTTLRSRGHCKVTICDPLKKRLDNLRNLGYHLVTPENLDKTQLYDVAIDCSGNCKAMEMALSLLKTGAKFLIFGVAPPEEKIRLSPYDLFMRELTILSVNVNPFSFPKALAMIESMGSRYLSYEKLGVALFELSEYQLALKQLESGTITKAMFKIN